MSAAASVRAVTEAREAIRLNENRVIVDDITLDQNASSNTISMLVVWRPLGSAAQQQRTVVEFEGGG
jgi:phage baseplate assembly protein W